MRLRNLRIGNCGPVATGSFWGHNFALVNP